MIAKAMGASKIITAVASEAHREASLRLGGDYAINFLEDDFVAKVGEFTQGQGVDVIVDIIGGDYGAQLRSRP